MEGEDYKKKLLNDSLAFQKALSDGIPIHACSVCNSLKTNYEMKFFSICRKDKLFNVIYGTHLDFPEAIYFKKKDGTFDKHLSRLFINISDGDKVSCCNKCYKDLKCARLPMLSLANRLDFGVRPMELRDLSLTETRMISIYNSITSIHSINFSVTSQKATTGGIAHIVNQLSECVKQLPRHPSQLGNYNVLIPLPDSVSNNKNLYYKPSKIRPEYTKSAIFNIQYILIKLLNLNLLKNGQKKLIKCFCGYRNIFK